MRMVLRTIWAAVLVLASANDPIFNLMPPDGAAPGWLHRGERRLFVGAALYQHIDGGAEPYHRNGFDRLAVQDYAKDAHEVRVEIYKMNEPAGAAAVFAEITAGMPTQEVFGTASVLDDYQILFQRGAYCVSLTTYECGAETSKAMAALAARIDAALAELAV